MVYTPASDNPILLVTMLVSDENAGKSLIFPALVETYAVLAFIISILMLNALS